MRTRVRWFGGRRVVDYGETHECATGHTSATEHGASRAPAPSVNEVSGNVTGPVVQAAVVHGGIHLHANTGGAGGGQAGPSLTLPLVMPASSLPTPRQLPRAPRVLVGREHELAQLDQCTDANGAGTGGGLIVLTGPAGVGKAAVGLTWLQREAAARFPDGQLYADLRSFGTPVQPLAVLRAFLAALAVAPENVPPDLAGSAALFRSATAGRRMAIMLHGAVSAAQVRPLLPGGDSCLTLVTSTWRLSGLGLDGAQWIAVEPLASSEAVRLLAAVAGEQRVAGEPQSAQEVAELCGGLPLAVCMVGNRLAVNPYQRLGRLAAELRDERRRLDRLTEESESGGVRAIIDACYRGLTPDAALLYRVLGALPLARFSLAPAAAGVGLPESEVSGLLRMLTEASLLQQVGEDLFSFHELVRLHAWELSRGGGDVGGSADVGANGDGGGDGEGESGGGAGGGGFDRGSGGAGGGRVSDAVVRVEQWYLATAISAATAVRPYRREWPAEPPEAARLSAAPLAFETARDALDWLDTEAPQLLGLARNAAEQGRPGTALRIAMQMWSLFAHRKYYRIWQEFDLLGLRCARELGDHAREARMLRRLGLLSSDLGRYDEATGHFGAAAALYERLGDRHRQATVINSLGVVALRRGDTQTAIGRLDQALRMHSELGDVRQCALVRLDLGSALIQAGRARDALEELALASEHLRASADLSSGARLRMLTGRARGRLGGETAAAEAELDSAVESMRALGSISGQAEALAYRAELAERGGLPTEAELYYEKAAELLDRLGTPSSGWLRHRISALSPLAWRVVMYGPSGQP